MLCAAHNSKHHRFTQVRKKERRERGGLRRKGRRAHGAHFTPMKRSRCFPCSAFHLWKDRDVGGPLLASPRAQGGGSDRSLRWEVGQGSSLLHAATTGALRRRCPVYTPSQGSVEGEKFSGCQTASRWLQKPPPGRPPGWPQPIPCLTPACMLRPPLKPSLPR